LTWDRPVSGDPAQYNIYWDSGTGTVDYVTALDTVADDESASYEWTSSRLVDGTYKFAVRAQDAAGNEETNVTVVTMSVQPAPEPVTNLTWSFNDGTSILTISWTASASSDALNYNVYGNGGTGPIDYATPIATTMTTSVNIDLTGQSGTYLYGVRTEDTVAQEEANVDKVIEVEVLYGLLNMRPNSPMGLDGRATAGATVELGWMYSTILPEAERGTCDHFNIYYDNATGTIDYGTIIDTVTLTSGRMTWTSGALTDGNTYKFAIRAATSGDVEDRNTDTVSVTADSTAPAAPGSFAGQVVT
jgi:hypothetical protein